MQSTTPSRQVTGRMWVGIIAVTFGTIATTLTFVFARMSPVDAAAWTMWLQNAVNAIRLFEVTALAFTAYQVLAGRAERRDAEAEAVRRARKDANYQAWQVINSAQGKGGSGGRIDALADLVRNDVSRHTLVRHVVPSTVASTGVRPQPSVTGGAKRSGTVVNVQPPLPG